MTTKEQERKVLAQIKKLVEGLGADSYIGMAFDGCIEYAEQNIENDWACSMKQRAESAEKKLCELQHKYDEDMARMKACKEHLEKCMDDAQTKAAGNFQEALKHAQHEKELEAENEKLQKRNDELEDQIKVIRLEAEDEIIHLKAKLYDMMTK